MSKPGPAAERLKIDGDWEDAVRTCLRAGPYKNPAAVALGRLGGKKGGPARAKKLSPERRSEIARKAAKARWGHLIPALTAKAAPQREPSAITRVYDARQPGEVRLVLGRPAL